MRAQDSRSCRPYWHADAKWVAGLLLLFSLGLALFLYNLWQLTCEKHAVEAMSTAMALTFSQKGLDDETEIAQFRRQLRASRSGAVQPIQGLRLTVREQDIAGRSPREIRLQVFRQLAEPIYHHDLDRLGALSSDRDTRQKLEQGIGPLAILGAETHRKLGVALLVLTALSALLLVPLVGFSHGFGRLASPGVVLCTASLPGFIAAAIVSHVKPVTVPPGEAGGMSGMIRYLAANVLPPLAGLVRRNYLVCIYISLVLLAAAFLGGIARRLAERARIQPLVPPSREREKG